jgi:hypothetical protein
MPQHPTKLSNSVINGPAAPVKAIAQPGTIDTSP